MNYLVCYINIYCRGKKANDGSHVKQAEVDKAEAAKADAVKADAAKAEAARAEVVKENVRKLQRIPCMLSTTGTTNTATTSSDRQR
jgi:hypothetical protein